MRVISIDIETTGKWVNTASMLSLGCVEDVNGKMTILEEYFMHDKPIPTSAIEVHGITNKLLAEKSQGVYFEDKVERLASIFWDPTAIAIGYNCNTFDFRVIDAALMELGHPAHKYCRVVDILSIARRRWKPSRTNPNQPANVQLDTVYRQCIKEFSGKESFIERRFDQLFPEGNKAHHTAAWDAYMTHYVAKCLCPEIFFDRA